MVKVVVGYFFRVDLHLYPSQPVIERKGVRPNNRRADWTDLAKLTKSPLGIRRTHPVWRVLHRLP